MMELRSGMIIAKNHPAINPAIQLSPTYLSFYCIYDMCGVSPISLDFWQVFPQLEYAVPPLLLIHLKIVCGVPTQAWVSDQIPSIGMCGVHPPHLHCKHLIFFVRCPHPNLSIWPESPSKGSVWESDKLILNDGRWFPETADVIFFSEKFVI